MAGNAKRRSSSIVIVNTTSVQIINPSPGVIRKLPDDELLDVVVAASSRCELAGTVVS